MMTSSTSPARHELQDLLHRLGHRDLAAAALLEQLAEQHRVVRRRPRPPGRASCGLPLRLGVRPGLAVRPRPSADTCRCQSMMCGSSCGFSCTEVLGSTSSTSPCSSRRRSSSLRGLGEVGEHEHRQVGGEPGERHLAQHVVAAHLGHHQVEQQQVEAARLRAQHVQALLAVRGHLDVEAVLGQHLADVGAPPPGRRRPSAARTTRPSIAPTSSSIRAISTSPSTGFIRCTGCRAKAVALSFSRQLALEAGHEDERDVPRLRVGGHALGQVPAGAQVGVLGAGQGVVEHDRRTAAAAAPAPSRSRRCGPRRCGSRARGAAR